ncbi:hypothetical protein C9374_006732 [Naegleria lovaniensis]|uniref:Uncharacterized protein n=1 Tax=Naegleria lovaniensis TaxID=51637 RepID=A0AA88KHJ1_NAELO|nr:uncharacterized protein C9374_006732 [Naegleria lovaniensis]KAG2379615.1 hypothetical protein C9374_006732 [Naegleria lovaniensis]
MSTSKTSSPPSSPIFPPSIPSSEILSSPLSSPSDSFLQNVIGEQVNLPELPWDGHSTLASSSTDTIQSHINPNVPAWLQNTYMLTKINENPSAFVKKRKHTHFSRLNTFLRNKDLKFSFIDFDLFSAPNDPLSERLEKAQQAVYVVSVHFTFPQLHEFVRFSLKAIMDAVPSLQHLPRAKSVWVKMKNQFYYTCDAKEDHFPKCDNLIELNSDDTVSSKKLENLNGLNAVSPLGAVLEFSLEKFHYYHPNTPLNKDICFQSRMELVCERKKKSNSNKKVDVWSERVAFSF